MAHKAPSGHKLIDRVYEAISDGQTHTLGEICSDTGGYPTTVSGYIRRLRKTRGLDIRSWPEPARGEGVWLYMLNVDKGQQELDI
jgi:hypothetical protein